MKRLLLIVLACLIPITCLGQVSLKASVGDKVIGWLLSRNGDNDYYTTPDGYLLQLNRVNKYVAGYVSDLYFNDENCAGQPYTNSGQYGEILRYGSWVIEETRHFRTAHLPEKVLQPANYELIAPGPNEECRPMSEPLFLVPAEFVNPADYGIQFVDGFWRVPIDSIVVDRPNVISCNGFESCQSQ